MHFVWQLVGKGQVSLLRQLQMLIPVSLGLSFGHAAVTNFYSSPVKKHVQFVMRRKMFSKRFKNNLPIFVFVFKLNGGLNHIICLFLFRFILFMLVLLLSFSGRL